MKVTGAGGVGQAGQAKSARAAGGQAFAPQMPGASGITAPVTARPVATVSNVDALLAMQEVGGPLERRRRAVGRAGRLLDTLEALKLRLLAGAVTPSALQALARDVSEERAHTGDERLESVLDEIETRAMVEMAKLELAQAAT